MPIHPLTNFEIKKYYQEELKVHGVCSRNDLRKIKGGAYVINLDEYKSIQIHWIALYVNENDVTYLASKLNIFQNKFKNHRKNNILRNINRMQAYSSIMCA